MPKVTAILVLSIIAYGYADKLDKGYLPPANAASSGGSPGVLVAPADQSEVFGQGLPVPESQSGSYIQDIGQEGFQAYKQERPQAAADRNAETLEFNNENNGESYAYNYETSNGISMGESGVATNGVNAQGGYAYTGDDGKSYSVTYTADVNGYQPQGEHLPTPHPIPEEILKSIEENAKAAAAGTQEGAYIPEEYESNANYSSKPGQESVASLDEIDKRKNQEINNKYNNPLDFVGQQYEIASSLDVNPSAQNQNKENGQDFNQMYTPNPYQYQQTSGIQGNSGFETSSLSPIQGLAEQFIQGDGYEYNQPKLPLQPVISGQDSLDQYRPQVNSENEKISSSSRPSSSDPSFNGDQNLKPSSGSLPSDEQSPQYQSGQQVLPEFRPSSFSGPNLSQNMKGSFPNQDQQIQIKESSGDLNENKGNGYHYDQPKPAFQPANSAQSSFDQNRPGLSGQNELLSPSSRPGSSGLGFNGDQNLKPSFGNRPSAEQFPQYQSGQQILPEFRPSSNSGPNLSQNMKGSFPNQDQQIQIKESSGDLNENKGNGYHYDQPKPAFQPANSAQSSFDQNRPGLSGQNELLSPSSRPGSSGLGFNGDQNLKPSFGNRPSAEQFPQYQSGQQILPEFRPSSNSEPNASQNMKGSFPNQDQQIQIKESSGDLNENKGNGYHYDQPKPAFQPANSGQSSFDQNRPGLSGQNELIPPSSRQGSSGSGFNGDQNLKPSFGNRPSAEQSPQYQSGQQVLPEFRPSSNSGPNAFQNMKGSFPNQDQQIQIKGSSGDLNENKGNGYHYDQPKPAFQPANSAQSSFDQNRPGLSGQNELLSPSSRPGSSGSGFNGDQNLKPSFGNRPSAEQFPQYQSGQQILPEFRPSSNSGPNASQNMKGSFPNQDQQIQIKESSGDLNENKGNGYHYDQPKPAFQPANSGQSSFDQNRPGLSGQNELIPPSSRQVSSGSGFNGDQNLKPSFGNRPSAEQSPQYQSGQQVLPEFRPSSNSGPNASQSMKGSFPNQDQKIQIKEFSGDLKESKGNGYHYDQPKPVFQPANSRPGSFIQYRPEISSQNQKISSSARPSSSVPSFSEDQNLKPSFGSRPSAEQSPKYQSGKQILPAFRPSYNRPNVFQNKESLFLNREQQIKRPSSGLIQDKGNGYQYNRPKPAFQPTISGQNVLGQYRPQVSNEGNKKSLVSQNSFAAVVSGNNGNSNPSLQNGPNGSQNKGSFPIKYVKNPGTQADGSSQGNVSPQFSILNKNKPCCGYKKPEQGSKSSPSQGIGMNKFGKGPVSSVKPIEAPYQYKRPSVSFTTQRPSSFSQTTQINRDNQDKGETFEGPRQPPSFSPEEGYKY
ncbi:unnamed protein product [Danaus chrysippus]|uniref:(African queen) hypothetical protein n=1 Tax=Danaus chrysippus TaxID=151541 RepID=A0A8J2VZE0_9NEOP|nr:unnamed protein product [Danaus chrysippus]